MPQDSKTTKKGLGSEGGKQQAEKHPTAEPKGLRSKDQGASPSPSLCHSITIGLSFPSTLMHLLLEPRERLGLEVWVNPWDGKILLIKITSSS